MKTAKEIYKGNKSRLNLPLHKLSSWSVWLLLSGLCWSLHGGSLSVWFIGLWLTKELVMDMVRSAWGCLFSILPFIVAVGIIIWLLILQHVQL